MGAPPRRRVKPGDLVEFKAGLFGVKPPQNLGIYLDRVRRKGTYFVVLFTVRGKQEVKPENVTSRRLTARVPADELEGDLAPRLKQLIEEVSKGKVETEARGASDASDRDLWQKAKDSEGAPLTPDELAALFFATKTPTRPQVADVRKILESCREPGVGYFEREASREERWRAITRAEHSTFHREGSSASGTSSCSSRRSRTRRRASSAPSTRACPSPTRSSTTRTARASRSWATR